MSSAFRLTLEDFDLPNRLEDFDLPIIWLKKFDYIIGQSKKR